MPASAPLNSTRALERITARGVTLSALETALGLSAGYLSKVRHGAVRPGEQLAILVGLLARHPSLLHELGVTARAPRPAAARTSAGATTGRALALVRRVAPDLDASGAAWALGGGVALAALGVRNGGTDVQLFVDDRHRGVLEVLRAAGASVGKLSSHAFIVFPPRSASHEDHVDLRFVTIASLRRALSRPARIQHDGAELPFLRPVHLCVQKLISHAPRDEVDARALLASGVVDRAAVRAALAKIPRLHADASPYARFHQDRALGERRLRESP